MTTKIADKTVPVGVGDETTAQDEWQEDEDEERLRRATDDFYDRIVADPYLTVFFEEADLDNLKFHTDNILTMALSKIPETMDVATMIIENRHSKFFLEDGLNEYHFDKVMAHLQESLKDHNFPQSAIDRAVATMMPLRPIFRRMANRRRLAMLGTAALVVGAAAVAAAAVLAIVRTMQRSRRGAS